MILAVSIISSLGIPVIATQEARNPWHEAKDLIADYSQNYIVVRVGGGSTGEIRTQGIYALLPKSLNTPTVLIIDKPIGKNIVAFTSNILFLVVMVFFILGWYLLISFSFRIIRYAKKT